MAIIWNAVFFFPIVSAGIINPSVAAIPLRPVTAISRQIMRATIQAFTWWREISIIRQADTKSLSANGSRIFPIGVTLFLLRAKNPSKKSVNEANKKQNAANKLHNLPGKNKSINNIGIKAIRISVKELGRLGNLFSLKPWKLAHIFGGFAPHLYFCK